MTRWQAGAGEGTGEQYAARFDALAAQGSDVHGEATCCEALVPSPARVLDAGCGTGRVAIRLAERGYDVTGADIDEGMLAVARGRAPGLRWVTADLAALDLGETFDLVVAAGNVIPLVAEGTEPLVVARLAAHLAPTGRLVVGFGLDREHLPPTGGLVPLVAYDAWCAEAGLVLEDRYATWDRDPYTGGSYAVSVHRLSSTVDVRTEPAT